MQPQGKKERGKFLYHTACLKCPSSDALSVYEREDGSLNGWCWSCETFFPSIDGEHNNTPIKEAPDSMNGSYRDLNWVLANTVIAPIPDRELNQESVDKYGIRVSFDQATGEIDEHFYPYYRGSQLVGYKVRNVADKKFYAIGTIRDVDLFGQHTCGEGGKMLVITEGELDAAAASQMFKERGKNYRVCSVPAGANSGKNHIEWINTFESIFLAFDQDEKGRQGAHDLAAALPPGKAHLMEFSEKDPSDMLRKGKSAEFFNSLYSAKPHRPDGIVGVDDVFEEAIKPVQWGLSWPWETLTKATYGFRRKEIYGMGGASGGGKTEYAKELINHIIEEHKLPVGVIFLEEPVAKTLKVLAGKKFNKRFHIPDGDWTVEELISGIGSLRGKVYLYNHYGSKDWESIKSKIRYMVVALGIKDIVLDHLTALIAQESDEYKALNKIMEEMASLVQELDCTIFYISHLRKANGTPHEEGGHVSADQFKGSGAIVYWSNFLFGIERNQVADDPVVRNTTLFRVLKDRNTGLATGTTFKLWYDHTTGRWREMTDEDGYGDL